MDNYIPDPDELAEWQMVARRRHALLPIRFQTKGHYTTLVCGNEECQEVFTRKLLPNRNDPIYVCPRCGVRNYLPLEW